MEKETSIYLAGLIDGDGCLSLSLSCRQFNKGVCITPQVRIALKGNDSWFLEQLQKEVGLGKIYYSNKGKENEICSWQTTSSEEAIKMAEIIYPYLRLKKEKCRKFIEIVKYYQQTKNPLNGKREKGKRLRTKEEIETIIKTAITINYDRQTKRYRQYHGWEYWKPIIDKLYES